MWYPSKMTSKRLTIQRSKYLKKMAIQEGFSMARLSFFDEVNFLLSKELRREKPFHNSLIQDKDLKNQGINTIIRRRKKDLILSR